MRVVSSVPGRQRWELPDLRQRPRFAAAVQAFLSRELPTATVAVNTTTGRVLIEWEKTSPPLHVGGALERALGAEPLSQEKYASLNAGRDPKVHGLVVKRLSSIELGLNTLYPGGRGDCLEVLSANFQHHHFARVLIAEFHSCAILLCRAQIRQGIEVQKRLTCCRARVEKCERADQQGKAGEIRGDLLETLGGQVNSFSRFRHPC